MRKVALCIAIEQYADERISTFKYAEKDAKAFAAALQELGFPQAEQTLLINATATKTAIESRTRRILASLQEEDELFLFYAGHGFRTEAGNYLTCHDTLVDDLDLTSLPLEWLLTQIRQCRSKKIILCLDAGENQELISAGSEVGEKELRAFFEQAAGCIGFAACRPGEKSYASDLLKQRIWSHHLIEALQAKAPLALEEGHLLTAASLQNYLSEAVARTLRDTHSSVEPQVPCYYGPLGEPLLLAELSPVLAKRKAGAHPQEKQLRQIHLLNVQATPVRQLSGFLKGFRIPDRFTDAAESFIVRLGDEELSADLQKVHDALRSAFKFKRKEIESRGPVEGGGSIITRYFDYEIRLALNPQDPSQVHWIRQIINIRNPEKILSAPFEEVFRGLFDTLEFKTGKTTALQDIIDQIENLDEEAVNLQYDKDLTWCDLRLQGTDSVIRITPDVFSIVQPYGQSTRQLIHFFFEVQNLLAEKLQLKRLPFSKGAKKK